MMMKNYRNMTGNLLVVVALLVEVFQRSEAGVISLKYGKYSTSGSFGGDGGQATDASFNYPTCTWINTNGEAFIVDGNERIRKVDTSGIISSYYGSSSSAVIGDGRPSLLVTGDTAGNMYFTSYESYKIYKIDSSLTASVFAGGASRSTIGTADNGAPATSVDLDGPQSITVDTNGDLYFTDERSNNVKKVTVSTGILTYVAGTGHDSGVVDISANNGDGGPATAANVPGPSGIFIDTSSNLYFGSEDSGIVRKVNLLTGIITTFAGGTTGGSGYSGDGGPATSALIQVGGFPGIAGDLTGNMYYSARNNNNVRKIDTSGIINIFAGDSAGTSGYTGNGGEATAALLYFPMHLFVYDTRVYITDELNQVVRSVTTTATPVDSTESPVASPVQSPTAHTTSSPTVTSSSRPSASPTVPVVAISFDSDFTLNNVTTSSLDTNCQNAVTSAVATTLNVSNDHVSYVSQQVVGGGARRTRRLSQAGYQIMVTVNVVASTLDFADAVNQNASYLYNRLSSTLMVAVSTNAFTDTLVETSARLGATALTHVDRTNVTIADYTVVTVAGSDDDSSGSSVSVGAIVGIVIGGVVVLVLLVIGVYFAVCRRSKKVAVTNTELPH